MFEGCSKRSDKGAVLSCSIRRGGCVVFVNVHVVVCPWLRVPRLGAADHLYVWGEAE